MKSSEHQPEPLQNSLDDDLHLIDQQFEQLLLRQHAVEHVRKQADAFSRLTGCEDPLSGDTEGEDEEDSFPSPDFSALDQAIFQQLDQTQKKRNRSRFFRYTQKQFVSLPAFWWLLWQAFPFSSFRWTLSSSMSSTSSSVPTRLPPNFTSRICWEMFLNRFLS